MVQAAPGLDFVGRASELARLEAAYARAASGAGSLVLVVGEAGIGKSRLIDRFAAGVPPDCRVVRGGCLELTAGEMPYAPFVEAIRALVRAVPAERRPALLAPGRRDLERLLPELATRAPDEAASGSEPDPLAQHRLFEVILGVVERLAGDGPVVLVVEDVQWADRASLDLIAFLARALRDEPVLIVTSVRPEVLERRGPVLSAVAAWERGEAIERIDVGPFGPDEVAAQVAALGAGPDPDRIAQLVAWTDGNPFFVEQIVRSGSESAVGSGASSGRVVTATQLPAALRDVLVARIEELDARDQDVLRAAAVVGKRIDDGVLAAILGRSPSSIGAALRRAVDAGLLVRDVGGTYRFRHALLREVVYGELFGGERTDLHRRVADALDQRAEAGEATISAGEIAHHRAAAGDDVQAIVAMVAAAHEAEEMYAFVDASRLWERALNLWSEVPDAERIVGTDRGDVLALAAEAAMLAGDAERAASLAREALGAIDASADPLRAGLVHERLRWFLWESGDRRAAAEAVADALRLIPADPPSAARSRAVAHRAGIELYAHEYEASRAHAEEAVAIARAIGAPGEEAFALGILGWDEAVLGDVERGLETFAEGVRIAHELGRPEGIALAATNLAALLDRVGRPDESLSAAQAALDAVRRLGVARTYGGLLAGYAAKALVALGRWDEAEVVAASGIRETVADRAVLWLVVNRARLRIGRGRFAEADADIERARSLDDALGGTEFRLNVLAAAAESAMWQGRIADVRVVVDTVAAMADPAGPPDPSVAWVAALGLRAEAEAAAVARARRDEAGLEETTVRARRIVAALARARRSATAEAVVGGTPRGRGLSLLCAAEARRAERRDRGADWSAVAEAWHEAGRPFPEAYARFREAEAILAARGDRHAAARALGEAARMARALEAGPLLTEVELLARHARLDVTGEPVPPEPVRADLLVDRADSSDDPAAGLGLTEREGEVLRLVAGGWSNQQIADELFISRKTASVHVSNILGKLGVRSRVEAAAVAHRLGLGRDAPPPPDSA